MENGINCCNNLIAIQTSLAGKAADGIKAKTCGPGQQEIQDQDQEIQQQNKRQEEISHQHIIN